MKKIENISYDLFEECKLDLYLPDSDRFNVLVYFHGGGLEGGDKDICNTFDDIIESGIAVVSANYRMYPMAKYPVFIEDAASSVKWVYDNINNYGEFDKVYIAGSSAGAYLSMMLCFDKKYLGKHGINSEDISHYIFDSAQPTTHFNVLRERGLDPRSVVIDHAAPIYHICENQNASQLLILVSDNDIPNRLEQTNLFCSTLKQFNYNDKKAIFKLMKGYGHCEYDTTLDSFGKNVLAEIIKDFINNTYI